MKCLPPSLHPSSIDIEVGIFVCIEVDIEVDIAIDIEVDVCIDIEIDNGIDIEFDIGVDVEVDIAIVPHHAPTVLASPSTLGLTSVHCSGQSNRH